VKAYALLASVVFLPAKQDCPPHFELGQTYHEIQQGVCPAIDSVAAFVTADSTHSAYYCRSKHTMIVGDRRTGRMDAFFRFVPDEQR
jgi:hypothetical protein